MTCLISNLDEDPFGSLSAKSDSCSQRESRSAGSGSVGLTEQMGKCSISWIICAEHSRRRGTRHAYFIILLPHLTASFSYHKQVLVSILNKKCSPCCQPGSTMTLSFQVIRNGVHFSVQVLLLKVHTFCCSEFLS